MSSKGNRIGKERWTPKFLQATGGRRRPLDKGESGLSEKREKSSQQEKRGSGAYLISQRKER